MAVDSDSVVGSMCGANGLLDVVSDTVTNSVDDGAGGGDTGVSAGKYAKITAGGVMLSDEMLSKVSGKNLSASLITGVLDCPSRWVSGYFLGEFMESTDDNALTRGSFFHRVMEHLFARPVGSRTRDDMVKCVEKTLGEKDFRHFRGNEDALGWLWRGLDGYLAMGANPDNVRVANYRGDGGLEVHITGELEGCKRKFHGFVDRLSVRKDGTLIVEDWKTGAKAKHFVEGSRFEDGWAETRQQLLYTHILNKYAANDSERVTAARLIFPIAGDIENVDVRNSGLIERAVSEAREAERRLDGFCEDNVFPVNPSILCSWCPLVKACASARAPYRRSKKAVAAYEVQPTVGELSVGMDIMK